MCNCGRRPAPKAQSLCGPGGCGIGPSVARPAVQPQVRQQVRPQQVRPAARPQQVRPPVRPAARPQVRQQVRPAIPAEGIDTALWGPAFWTVLHITAQSTRLTQHRPVWTSILDGMKSALPCPECTAHYNAWFATHPLTLGDDLRVAVSTWVLALHNDVNVRNGKAPWTLEQVAAAYTNRAAFAGALKSLRPYMPAAFLRSFEYIR